MGVPEAFQQSHAELLGLRVRVRRRSLVGRLDPVVGGSLLEEALDPGRTVGAQRSVGLDYLHSWQKNRQLKDVQ